MTSVGSASTNGAWSVILAGGEGERTRSFIEEWLGYHRPKQYCAFVGRRSLFQHTVDRADRVTSASRRVIVAAESHRDEVSAQLRGRVPGTVVLQPRNRGTAPGVFLALTHVKALDPEAVVTLFPSDHFVHPERRFELAVAEAIDRARGTEDRLVLLGVRPQSPETQYGWIEAQLDGRTAAGFPVGRVRRFLEKPDLEEARRALGRGAIWNTLVVTGTLKAFWDLGTTFLPEVMGLFDWLAPYVGLPGAEARMMRMYGSMPSRDLSSDVLERCPEALTAIELDGVRWSDWGCPQRIRETLRAIGKKPAFADGAGGDERASARTTDISGAKAPEEVVAHDRETIARGG